MVMEPYFHWLPLLGLLYVLVPYYNQFEEDDNVWDDDDDDREESFDYNAWEWDKK